MGCKVNRRLEECRPGLRGILIDQKIDGWVYLLRVVQSQVTALEVETRVLQREVGDIQAVLRGYAIKFQPSPFD